MNLFRTDYVESDVDEELLFNVPFKGHVKITGLALAGDLDETHPASLRLYKDRPSVSMFDMDRYGQQCSVSSFSIF